MNGAVSFDIRVSPLLPVHRVQFGTLESWSLLAPSD